jgi:hypothetical protein
MLPEEIRQLIIRKLQLQWQEQLQRDVSASQLTYSKLRTEIESVIGTSKINRAFTSIPLAAFEEKVAEAIAGMRNWPSTVFETITSTLDKLQLVPSDSKELHAITDEFVWGKNQTPFTHWYVTADSFKDNFYHLIGSCGVQSTGWKPEFERMLDLKAKAAECEVLNFGRWAREEIGVDIDEYVIERQLRKTNQIDNGITDNSFQPYEVSPPPPRIKATCRQSEVFLKMKNLTSDELCIRFVGDYGEMHLASNNMLEISARDESRRFAPSDLDLLDGRSSRVNSQGMVLLGMARKLNPLNTPPNGKKISRLREIIRKNFGVQDDPFEHLCTSGWLPRFQIIDARGLADERAKQAALRRTVSLDREDSFAARCTEACDTEYPFESEGDETDHWMKKHS